MLIPKFIFIAKRTRFTLEQLAKLIIGDDITFKKKKVLTKMLYNREAILAGEFLEMEKVKEKVVLPQKI